LLGVGGRKPLGLARGFSLSSSLVEIEVLASSFLSFIIKHVIRLTNIMAHLCAMLACTLETMSCWMGTPSFLTSSIIADCAGGDFEYKTLKFTCKK
jgi:hypothetical protein